MPLQATSGAASYDAYGGGAAAVPNYIEDVFQTWLYTGNGTSQTITNGIDLSTKGGLVWIKDRTTTGVPHRWFDTARGGTKSIRSNSTSAENTGDPAITFNTTGFTTSTDVNGEISASGDAFASWTFRKQPKFFDVVTYTGNATTGRTIPHNLGSVPGCIILKNLTTGGIDWIVYHRSLGASQAIFLNLTNAAQGYGAWNYTAPTSTNFTVSGSGEVNGASQNYVAYLFAHDAGGFGLTGTDNVISCGSYTGTGAAGNAVTLGYEPQWLMVKKTTSATQSDWVIFDNMRGWPVAGSADQYLWANSINAEGSASTGWVSPNATGFQFDDGQGRTNGSGETYIYIAIRRGPMKVPTDATKVFYPYAASAPGNAVVTTGFPVDLQIQKNAGAGTDPRLVDRLRGVSTTPTSPSAAFPFLVSSDTTAESTGTGTTLDWGNTGFTVGNTYAGSAKAWAVNFRRAPGFFDEVCWTGDGTGSSLNVPHNLGTVPLLLITKKRSTTSNWETQSWNGSSWMNLRLNTTGANSGNSSGVATEYTFNPASIIDNISATTYVTYLFATCAGVSKVGLYTGTGATQTIDCGFGAGGSRFVLIKRTDSTGDWYVWDSARGMISGTDPSLLLNSTAAEVNANSVYAISTGFQIVSTAAGINASAGTYIFLSVA